MPPFVFLKRHIGYLCLCHNTILHKIYNFVLILVVKNSTIN